MAKELLKFDKNGIYCPKADVYIDPWKPVKKALITHGHADHARLGHSAYLAHHITKPIMQYRLGRDINVESVGFSEAVTINGVKFSFHPAGHIPGSGQVRVEYKGEVWLVSGDYKLENDGISTPFEPVKCHTFITECTFGLPVYKWVNQSSVADEINGWWRSNKEKGLTSVIGGYSLGKAQRIIAMLNPELGRIYTHGAIENMNEVLRKAGVFVQPTIRVTPEIPKGSFTGNIVVATPSGINSPWMKKFRPYSTGIASGWMTLRGARRRRAVDRGFVLSDHADWEGLNKAIDLSGAKRVVCTHGYTSIFSKWISDRGIEAIGESTEFEGELYEIGEGMQTGEE